MASEEGNTRNATVAGGTRPTAPEADVSLNAGRSFNEFPPGPLHGRPPVSDGRRAGTSIICHRVTVCFPGAVAGGMPETAGPESARRLFQAKDILHIVEAGTGGRQKFHRTQRAPGEGVAAGSLVGEFHPFAVNRENDGVVAHHVAAAQ